MADESLDAGRQRLGLSHMDLWVDYFALGGLLDLGELARCLRGERQHVSDTDHDVIAHALNERFRGLGQNHPMAYRSVA